MGLDSNLHPVYFQVNLIFSAINGAFTLCFLLLKLPDHHYLNNDRLCRYFILGNYIGVTFFSMLRAFAFDIPGGDTLRVQTALSLDYVSCVCYFLPLSFMALINAKEIRSRFSAIEFVILVALNGIHLSLVFIPGLELAADVVFWIFFLFFISQLVRAGLMILPRALRFRLKLDNYFSGKEQDYFLWFIPVTVLMLVCGLTATLEFLFPSWFLLLVQTGLSALAAVLLAVYFLNNLFIFKFFEPVITELEEDKTYKYSKLVGLDVESLARQLDRCMRTQKPYVNPQLTIAEVARMIKLNVHQTSELINARMKTSFRQYINSFRIEEAQRLLEQEKEDTSILDIAFKCGFNSKSTFNAIFLAAAGKTPSQWREEHQKSSGTRPKAAQREPAR